uniref:Uncharacterized protein n=1 Tax=Ditylenchus dipsaci TaxID=166011 RepID=A0A915CLP9_9BILA
MTPLFQDDHMLNSQASGRFLAGGGSSNNLSSLPNGPSQSVWPSEMGYFEHHRQHAAPPQTPLFNGSNGGPVPIVGGGHHSNAAPIRGGSFSSGGSSGTVEPLLKFDLLKRPSDLSLMTNGGNGQPAMLNLPMLPKKMNNAATATMDSATQTDNRNEELDSNTERVDRSTGSNSPICQCKCNCRPNSTETNNNNSNNNNHNPAPTPTPPNPALSLDLVWLHLSRLATMDSAFQRQKTVSCLHSWPTTLWGNWEALKPRSRRPFGSDPSRCRSSSSSKIKDNFSNNSKDHFFEHYRSTSQ